MAALTPAALCSHLTQAHNTACVLCVLTIVCLWLCHNEILALDTNLLAIPREYLCKLSNNNEILVTHQTFDRGGHITPVGRRGNHNIEHEVACMQTRVEAQVACIAWGVGFLVWWK